MLTDSLSYRSSNLLAALRSLLVSVFGLLRASGPFLSTRADTAACFFLKAVSLRPALRLGLCFILYNFQNILKKIYNHGYSVNRMSSITARCAANRSNYPCGKGGLLC